MRVVLIAAAATMVAFRTLLAIEPLLQPGDRVAIVGGTFAEQMQGTGALEAELQCRRPDWRLSVRNLGWSGDDVHGTARKGFDSPEDGFRRLLRDIETSNPTVVLIMYGFAEATDGGKAVARFDPGLRRLISELQQQGRRLVLMAPVAMPGCRVEQYRRWMHGCRQIVARVGQELGIPVLSIDWVPENDDLAPGQLLPNEHGYRRLARWIAGELVGGPPARKESLARLTPLIIEKNRLFFHRYRPQNETYLYLFRKHEQGNNAAEIPQFDPLIEQAEQAIWNAARTK